MVQVKTPVAFFLVNPLVAGVLIIDVMGEFVKLFAVFSDSLS